MAGSGRSNASHKRNFKLPIAIHLYTTFIIVILLMALTMMFITSGILETFIAQECNKRIETARMSCNSLAQTFSASDLDINSITDSDVGNSLLNAIVSSADISNEANIALIYTRDPQGSTFNLLWPTSSYSIASYNNTNSIIAKITEQNGINVSSETKTINIDGSLIYYKILDIKFSPEENVYQHLSNYYIVLFVNSRPYYSLTESLVYALIQVVLIITIVAGVLSLFNSVPLYLSTKHLSEFSKRIGRGDYRPINTERTASRELTDLSIQMNIMARKLEKNDLEQKTFFQNASHELRTPLMSIQGYAEGIKYGVFENEEKDKAVDVIIDETERLTNMVSNLLTISKMDMAKSGDYTVKKQVINCAELAENAIDKVRGHFIHDDKELVNDITKEDLYIYANESDIFRMLENIFSNCLRYCEHTVNFICRKDESGRNIEFTIYDDGPGISSDVEEKLFDRFATGTAGKHGIGLALAKSIAEEHKGTIKGFNMKNDDGTNKGACFVIMIPLLTKKEQLTKLNKER
ncbi:Signal transduction histidine kinase [Ruminococcaceae bacterium YRB3002]|nr:Signal transduction histidine kinase [Ruminococcaceae bacterium YRB3002]